MIVGITIFDMILFPCAWSSSIWGCLKIGYTDNLDSLVLRNLILPLQFFMWESSIFGDTPQILLVGYVSNPAVTGCCWFKLHVQLKSIRCWLSRYTAIISPLHSNHHQIRESHWALHWHPPVAVDCFPWPSHLRTSGAPSCVWNPPREWTEIWSTWIANHVVSPMMKDLVPSNTLLTKLVCFLLCLSPFYSKKHREVCIWTSDY